MAPSTRTLADAAPTPSHLLPAPLALLLHDASDPSHKYYRLQLTPLPVLRSLAWFGLVLTIPRQPQGPHAQAPQPGPTRHPSRQPTLSARMDPTSREALTTGLLAMARARSAKRSVEQDSSNASTLHAELGADVSMTYART